MRKTTRLLQLYFLLSILEGIPSLTSIFRIPSDPSSASLFGFSIGRVAIGIASLVLILVFTYGYFRSVLDAGWIKRVEANLQHLLRHERTLHRWIFVLSFTAFFGIVSFAILSSPWQQYFGSILIVFQRISSLYLWFVLICFQTLLTLLIIGYPIWAKWDFFYRRESLVALLTLSVLTLTAVHWSILLLQDPVLENFPYWWGSFTRKAFTLRDLLFLPVVGLSLFLLYRILRQKRRFLKYVLLTAILGFLIQGVFGYIEGSGFDSLLQKLLNTSQRRYVMNSGPDLDFIESIKEYETRFAGDRMLGTKPPGALTFFIAIEKIANVGTSSDLALIRQEKMLDFVKYFFPGLSIVSLIFLWRLSRQVLPEENALVALLIFSVVPSFVLKQHQLDQYLYPTLFLLGVYLEWKAVASGSFSVSLLAGVIVYLTLFVSFSLLPLIAFILGLAFLVAWRHDHPDRWKRAGRVIAGFLLGLTLCALLLLLVFAYDPIHRYQLAMESHRIQKNYEPGLAQIAMAIPQNVIEFTFWVGVPLILFSFARWTRAILHFFSRQLNDMDTLALALLGVFGGLNLLGQTRGEVSRIWIFLVPFFVIMTLDEVRYLYKRHKTTLYLLLSAELITTFLMFKFHDRV